MQKIKGFILQPNLIHIILPREIQQSELTDQDENDHSIHSSILIFTITAETLANSLGKFQCQ